MIGRLSKSRGHFLGSPIYLVTSRRLKVCRHLKADKNLRHSTTFCLVIFFDPRRSGNTYMAVVGIALHLREGVAAAC